MSEVQIIAIVTLGCLAVILVGEANGQKEKGHNSKKPKRRLAIRPKNLRINRVQRPRSKHGSRDTKGSDKGVEKK